MSVVGVLLKDPRVDITLDDNSGCTPLWLVSLDEMASEVFALVVFLCDDLFQLKPAATSNPATAAARFFITATKLPMELQMVLCYRAVGSMKQNILRKDSEAAFKSLASILSLSQL